MKKRSLLLLIILVTGLCAGAKQLNDKLLNRPYADLKAWHLGFSVGLHMQDLQFTNNSGITADGQQWFAEQPGFSPGFCVNGLVDFRLGPHLNVRLAPGIWFGNKVVSFRDATSGTVERQNIKSTLLVLPVDLKFSATRFRNVRPYITGGVMPVFDVGKHRTSDLIQLKKFDTFLTVGFGLDTYFPYFKFIPEVKFCFGVIDALHHKRPDLADVPDQMKYTNALERVSQKMIVFTFYFE